jgi:hypothetical protein
LKFDHGAITIYQYHKNKDKLNSSPIHIFQVEHDTIINTRMPNSAAFKLTFSHGDLLQDGTFLKPQSITFQVVNKERKYIWCKLIDQVIRNLQINFHAGHKAVEHGQNLYHGRDVPADVSKKLAKKGTFITRLYKK